jgi:hypothetical protein
MRKPLTKSWQAAVMIVTGVLFYLADCLIAHARHPEVSWLKSGIYNWGPFGIFATAICVLGGFYFLLRPEEMPREIDEIIHRLRAEIPGVEVTQLQVSHRGADDDGLWFIRVPSRAEKVQIESSGGRCPFLIESGFSAERFHAQSVEEVVSTVRRLYALPSTESNAAGASRLPRGS